MKKRLVRLMMLAGGGLVVLAIVLALVLHHMGAGTIQDWIGTQIQDIANSYLNPKLSFTDLVYEYPLTVSLKNLHLTADDPANPGHKIDIIACQHATVALAQIPSIGKPIVIQKIILDQPLISAVAVAPRSPEFVGFSNLVRGGSSSSAPEATPSGPGKKLSDVFQMRLVQITNGKVVYDPRIPGTVPMALDQINTLLNIEPTEAGWYKLDTVIARKPVFEVQLAGQLNLDSFSVRGVDIKLLADLGQDKLDYLPPELQAMLKQYDARGKLNVEVTGSMPIMDPMKGQVETTVKLDRANIAMGGLRIPVDNLDLDARFDAGKATLSSLKIVALGGSADLSGSATLNDRLDADMHLKVAGMVLEKLLADPALASGSDARLDLDFNIAGSIMSVLGKAPAKPGEPLAAIGVKDFRLSADDPVNPGQKIELAACKSLDVAMTEPIVSGKPIVIDKIILDQLAVSAVAVAPGASRFVGMPNLPPSAPSGASAPMPKLGDLLRVKVFQLKDARIVYDPRIPGTQRMVLDQINTSLNVDPNDPGKYTVSTDISRKPVFNLGINGEIDIDDPGLQNLNVDLEADLTQDQLDFLPPQLQLILKRTKAKGKLSVKAGASVAMSDLARGKAHLDVDVRNIQLNEGDIHIPVDDLSISARLEDGKVQQAVKIAALNNVFDLSGTVALNSRLDTDTTLTLKDVQIEPLLAALQPNQSALTTSTKLSAAIEIQSPIMVALGAVAGAANEQAASLTVRHLNLVTDDPRTPGTPLEFAACDRFGVVLRSLPAPGKPIAIDRVVIEHPAIRAVAMGPDSKAFAGFSALEKIAASQSGAATAPSADLASAPTGPAPPLSDVIRLRTLSATDASLYYDPRIDDTAPFSLHRIAAKIDQDSQAGDAYRFELLVPSKPDLNLELAGRLDVDDIIADPLALNLTARVGAAAPTYLPPQAQKLIKRYDLVGSLAVKVAGRLPLRDPKAGDLETDVNADGVAATAGGYRIPIEHLRLPIRLKGGRVEFQDAAKLGGPMLEALNGSANLTGTVTLNDRLDSTLSLITDGMLLQTLMADKIAEPRKQLIGAIHADVELVNAPIMVIVAKATSRPSADASEAPSRLATADLPANWGSADIELTQARLVGFELIQGMSNIAKSVFTDLFNRQDKDKPQVVVPKESAKVVCTFDKDHISISNLHYDGEDLAADGKGYVTLNQQVNLDLTGGPISKLGSMGSVGAWIKNASDSLLYYHVSGTFSDLKIESKMGNGTPIVQGAKNITEKGVKAVGTGLDKAGSFIHGLFNRKDSDKN